MKRFIILALFLFAPVAWAKFPFPSPMLQSKQSAPTSVACNGVSSPSQLVAWYDASGLATSTTNSYGIVDGSGNVSQWSDKSGNSNNATASAKPTLNIAAANGLNTVRFTGASSQYFTLASSVSSVAPWTMISVVRHGGPTGTASTVELSNLTVTGAYSTWWFTDNKIYYGQSTTNVATSGTQTDTASYHIITADTSGLIRFDRSVMATSPTAFAYTTTFTDIGAQNTGGTSYYANSDMAELCFYNAALSSTDYSAVENGLRTKWGTP